LRDWLLRDVARNGHISRLTLVLVALTIVAGVGLIALHSLLAATVVSFGAWAAILTSNVMDYRRAKR